MRKLAILAVAAAASAALAAPASAEGWYAGLGYTHFDFDNAEVGGLTGRLGYRLHPNIAVEGEATMGVDDDDAAELDNAFGVYAVGIVPVSPAFDLFGRVGYQELSIDTPGPSAETDGLGYGVGANFKVSERFGIRGDYTRLDSDDGEADTLSLGGVVNF